MDDQIFLGAFTAVTFSAAHPDSDQGKVLGWH